MGLRADELPTDELREQVDLYVYETFGGSVDLTGLYIFGSFGANTASRDSDLYVLVTLGEGADSKDSTDVAHVLGGVAMEFEGHVVDPVAVPREDAEAYLTKACSARGYETVYDVFSEDYCPPDGI